VGFRFRISSIQIKKKAAVGSDPAVPLETACKTSLFSSHGGEMEYNPDQAKGAV
jgi:hypothetical protein